MSSVSSQSLKILAFAQARFLLGFEEKTQLVDRSQSPREIVLAMDPLFFEKIPAVRVALDCRYASWDQPIEDAQEMAIIPPVSGG
ncbi:MoaD/ThiS family protein [Methylacidiphilum caldifontis]|uniref:Molybdopterin synthase sulfur carrier subunit n=1 Tax=Methylacidiphilum caldifontis TaxID=2795386 RepID=A0A4Y8P953_9BACT|nr:MoaD/ThiS family protein [Methylacidiphilum caldifontis]QSR89497.1 MoaD/ThiS family protein [Methylacidiphilum caldifontis]TFE67209.1 molybdopterin synthase sulfur carrier subunit [Methylacidiphilum caldifontis]